MDGTYAPIIAVVLGVLIGLLISAFFVVTSLLKKLGELDKVVHEIAQVCVLLDERSIALKDIQTIEDRTRYMMYMPVLEERTRLLLRLLPSFDADPKEHVTGDLKETQRISSVPKEMVRQDASSQRNA